MRCGTCNRSWDDDKPTGLTPTPSARCPFEYFRGHSGPKEKPKPKLPEHPEHGTPNLFKYMDLSTGFLTAKDHGLLAHYAEKEDENDEPDEPHPRIVAHRYGWWVNVQWEDEESYADALTEIRKIGLSRKFLNVFKAAAANGCNWINFDSGA